MRVGRAAPAASAAIERAPHSHRAPPAPTASGSAHAPGTVGRAAPSFEGTLPAGRRPHALPNSGTLQRELAALLAPQPNAAHRAGAPHSIRILEYLVDELLPELALDPEMSSLAAAMLREEIVHQHVVAQYATTEPLAAEAGDADLSREHHLDT